jgi:hypothetical protein
MYLVACSKQHNTVPETNNSITNTEAEAAAVPEVSAPRTTFCFDPPNGNRYERVRQPWYHINNNVWQQNLNGVGRQCIWHTDQNNWGADASHSFGNGQIKSYASVILGNHYGDRTQNGSFPLQASNIISSRNLYTRWIHDEYNANHYNASYDIWFDEQARENGNNSHEIMIWPARKNQEPIAERYDGNGAVPWKRNINIDGKQYNIYRGSNGQNKVLTFIPISSARDFSANLKAFIKRAVDLGWMTNRLYCTSVQAGWEIISGGNFVTRRFEFYYQ